ncbi:MAG: hypothetical protein NT034_03920 [Candidatus Magasanikbacteria bacterium]|nr:hypothetical protein [Candidatus Magasanikbacteria bacterium]
MKIALCHSMQYAEKVKEVADFYRSAGHEAFASSFNDQYLGLNDEEKEKLKLFHKYEKDAMREHWNVIEKCDKVLVLNFDKHGIPGYIGGNSFLEMGFAYILKKPIYLLNPIPKIPYYETEIIAMKPTVLNGDLEKIYE